MTKEQLYVKWLMTPDLISDLEAVIATEIEKAKEVKPEELKGNCSTFDGSRLVDQVQPALNPIEQAYESGIKIRHKGWHENSWIQKLSETEAIDELKKTYDDTIWAFRTEPHKWELYTEPEQPAKPFDKERFERMFRAVYQSTTSNFEKCIEYTKENLTKLDAYYATKEGGANV